MICCASFRLNHNHIAIVIDEFGRVAVCSPLKTRVGANRQIRQSLTCHRPRRYFGLARQNLPRQWRYPGEQAQPKPWSCHCGNDAHLSFETISGLIAHQMTFHLARRADTAVRPAKFSVRTPGGAVRWLQVACLNTLHGDSAPVTIPTIAARPNGASSSLYWQVGTSGLAVADASLLGCSSVFCCTLALVGAHFAAVAAATVWRRICQRLKTVGTFWWLFISVCTPMAGWLHHWRCWQCWHWPVF